MKKISIRASSVRTSSVNILGRAARQQVEMLEGRRLLSSVMTSGTLTLTGTSGVDSFVVTKSGSNVSVVENGGAAKLYAISSVTRIDVSLGNGNDTLNIGNSLSIPASVNGGDGNDGIITGAGNDTIDGGTGNDYIEGRDGQDLVSYASRTEGVTAEINIDLTWRNGLPPIVGTSGAGGVVGENDTYLAVESLAGGSGRDYLTLSADVWSHFDTTPVVPDLGAYGNGGDDVLIGRGVVDGSGNAVSNGHQLLDGGAGVDDLNVENGSWNPNVTVRGGSGDDNITAQPQFGPLPVFEGGADFDTLGFPGRPLTQNVTIPNDVESLYVSQAAASVTGNDLANQITIITIVGSLVVDGRGGDDKIEVGREGGEVPATVLGGEGNDTIRASANKLYVDAGGGDDHLELFTASHEGDGVEAHQTVTGGGGSDVLELLSYYTSNGGASTVHLVKPETFRFVGLDEAAHLVVEKGPTAEANVLRVGSLYVANAEYDPQGSINLNDNPMIVSKLAVAGDVPEYSLQEMTDLIQLGKFGGDWGLRGVRSTLADANPGMTLGVALASELFGNAPATFAGQSVLPSDVLVRYTRAGDLNLDRKVDFSDLVILAQNYGQSERSYARGNANLSEDNAVDFDDLVLLSQNYGASISPLTGATIESPQTPVAASSLLDLATPAKSRPKSVRAKMN